MKIVSGSAYIIALLCVAPTSSSCTLRSSSTYALTDIEQCQAIEGRRDLLVTGTHLRIEIVEHELMPATPTLEETSWVLLNNEKIRTCDDVVGQTFATVEEERSCYLKLPGPDCLAVTHSLVIHEFDNPGRVDKTLTHRRDGEVTVIGERVPFTGTAVEYSRDGSEGMTVQIIETQYQDGRFESYRRFHDNGEPGVHMTVSPAGDMRIRYYDEGGRLMRENVELPWTIKAHDSLVKRAYTKIWDEDGHMTCTYQDGEPCLFSQDGSVMD